MNIDLCHTLLIIYYAYWGKQLLQVLQEQFHISLKNKINNFNDFHKLMLRPQNNPAGIYLFKVNNGNPTTICEIFSKLTSKRFHTSGACIVDFELINDNWETLFKKYKL